MSDSETERRRYSLLSWLMNRKRPRRPAQRTEYSEEIQPQFREEVEYIYENGVPVRGIIRMVPTDSTITTTTDRLPPPPLRVTDRPDRRVIRETTTTTNVEPRIFPQPTTGITDIQFRPPIISTSENTRILPPTLVSTETRTGEPPDSQVLPPLSREFFDYVETVVPGGTRTPIRLQVFIPPGQSVIESRQPLDAVMFFGEGPPVNLKVIYDRETDTLGPIF